MSQVASPSGACEVVHASPAQVGAIRAAMPAGETVVALAETFKALGDPTRVKIAFALSREELCVCDLANLLGASESAVSHSLRTLRQLKLVKFRREGKIAYYSLDDDHIRQLLDLGFEHVGELV